jgi:Ras-related protein Rab-1A
VDYKAKEVKIENEMVKLQIWDTAGQERFRSMTSAFYNKAHGIILVFDVSQEESFRSLTTWIRDIRRV